MPTEDITHPHNQHTAASSLLPAIILKAHGKQATSPAGKRVAGLASVTLTPVDVYLDSARAPSLSSPFLCGLLAHLCWDSGASSSFNTTQEKCTEPAYW